MVTLGVVNSVDMDNLKISNKNQSRISRPSKPIGKGVDKAKTLPKKAKMETTASDYRSVEILDSVDSGLIQKGRITIESVKDAAIGAEVDLGPLVKSSLKRDSSSIDAGSIKPKKLRFQARTTQDAVEKGIGLLATPGPSPTTKKTHMKKFISTSLDKTAKFKAIKLQNKGNKNNQSGEVAKPDWTILKKETKEKRKERKMKKCPTVYDMTVEAKQMWEKLRVEKGDHTGLTSTIHSLLKTHLAEVVFTHEMSRVLQWLLHLGSHSMRLEIVDELAPVLNKMILSKYASKCVMKMLKHGDKNCKQIVIKSFMGHVVKLTRSVLSAPVVEFAYEHASSSEKNLMRQELYSDLFKGSKDDSVKGLEDVFKAMPQLKDAHLACIKKNLTKMLDKKVSKSSLFYDVLRDYMQHCTKEDGTEMMIRVRETLMDLPDTDAAAEVGMQCVIHATNKEKKAIMKSLKENVAQMVKSKYLYQIVIALIDSIDDTVAFSKIVLPELIATVEDMMGSIGGRNVVVYLAVGQDVKYWPSTTYLPTLQKRLLGGTSKKSPEVRQKEIWAVVNAPFLDAVASNVAFWVANTKITFATLAIFKAGFGESLVKAYNSLCAVVCDASQTKAFQNSQLPFAEHPVIHALLKQLIRLENEGVGKLFASILTDHLSPSVITYLLTCTRGSFLLVLLLETGSKEITDKVKSRLEPFADKLKTSTETSHMKDIIARKLSE